ncbi:probable inactive shikimate kinase like 1, chloroplastic isoform X1 [Chenopodium quinoa]|uniref:probable inactive shikimate kinase like 1, chloroplastic isoform X1 n=1 Tax=Chenopodium quinoa TaxID=63459 RepID=UPI000B786058|nr:probable inactive shikimate kinase like 1, chloroplastic isoform X1 [Chenopodium quinoa]XP_021760144.1 probable inactive shikimate kinase like 1, chloroplastic isoform X1 [Chenopodium quinoa]
MEIRIRPAIQCICRGSSLASKPTSSSLHFPLSSSSSHFRPPTFYHQWRNQLTTARSLADGNLATEPATSHGSLALKKKATDICADLKGASIFIVGMKSAMKTSVGKLIADELRYYYFDSDNVVEEAAGEDSSGKSFKERDEDGFQKSETEVLKQLSSLGRLVVNAGNGAVQSMTNLALLRHGITIWIDVPLDIIAKESVRDDEQSTMSTPDTFSEALDELTLLYEENKGGYATADTTISLQTVATKLAYDEYEQVTAEDMALEVLSQIEKLTRVKKLMEEAGRPF